MKSQAKTPAKKLAKPLKSKPKQPETHKAGELLGRKRMSKKLLAILGLI